LPEVRGCRHCLGIPLREARAAVLSLPEMFTARYFAHDLLASGEIIPVGISYEPPVVPLGYTVEHHVGLLAPEKHMLRGSLAEWRPFCYAFWAYLNDVGVERIRDTLDTISHRHPGKALVLLDYENMELGHRSHRAIFARWWEEKTSQPVYELTNDGQQLHYTELHKQARASRPRDHDPRWTEDPVFEWPLTDEKVTEWLAGRYWQTARSTENPHSYTHRDWGDPRMFEFVILHMREHGEQEIFGGVEYTYYLANYLGAAYKHWTMGDGLSCTVILNKKEIGQDRSEELLPHTKRARRAQPKLSDIHIRRIQHDKDGDHLQPRLR
jgi:hypothetical protein